MDLEERLDAGIGRVLRQLPAQLDDVSAEANIMVRMERFLSLDLAHAIPPHTLCILARLIPFLFSFLLPFRG
jgi:hypothetical protein